jgi:uncharacterized membrane protein YedE/YeeE
VNKPFGALGGFIDVSENAISPQRLGFRAYLLAGLVAGGGLFALISGSVLFGAGRSLAATCSGPVAVMIGQGRLAGLFVAAGLLVGVTLQCIWKRAHASRAALAIDISGAAGL